MVYYIQVHSDDLLKTASYPLCGFHDLDHAMAYILQRCDVIGGVWPQDASQIKFVPKEGESGADAGMIWSLKCLEMR